MGLTMYGAPNAVEELKHPTIVLKRDGVQCFICGKRLTDENMCIDYSLIVAICFYRKVISKCRFHKQQK